MIFVSGSNGWLGLNLIEAIVKGETEKWGLKKEKIKAFILPGTSKEKLKSISSEIEIIEGDILNLNDTHKFLSEANDGILFHTAGVIHPKKVSEFYDVNLKGTENLLESALQFKVRKTIIMSSNSPCGCNSSREDLFDENSKYNPYMNYGKSKMLMEQLANKYYEDKSLDLTIIRSPWFYGPYQPPRQKTFFEMIQNGKVPIVGDGKNKRSMAYTKNIVQGLILSATKSVSSGKTYWIADEAPYTMNEIVEKIEYLLDKKFKKPCNFGRINLPGFVSQVAEKTDSLLQSFGFYHQKIHVLSEMNKNIACSIALAKDELGYNPEFDLEKGMYNSLFEIYG